MLFGAEVMRPSCFEETQWLFLLRKFALSYCYSNLAILSDLQFSRNSHLTSKRFFTHGKHLSSLHNTSLVLLTHRTCCPEPTSCNFMFLITDSHHSPKKHYWFCGCLTKMGNCIGRKNAVVGLLILECMYQNISSHHIYLFGIKNSLSLKLCFKSNLW